MEYVVPCVSDGIYKLILSNLIYISFENIENYDLLIWKKKLK